jgi:hypothetical protein
VNRWIGTLGIAEPLEERERPLEAELELAGRAGEEVVE